MAERPNLHIAVAKTKNKASEYNDNFDMMMDFIDATLAEAKDYVDGYMPEQTGKSGRFLTTNGTAASWVSLGSNLPFSKYIEGLIISKTSNTQIAVSAGCCYNSTGLILMTLPSGVTKQNTSQAANATYHVYLISNGSSNVDVLISTTGTTPTLPTGYSYYRKIGYFTTNANSQIDDVFYFGVNSNSSHSTIYLPLPDYSSSVTLSGITTSNKTFNLTSNGYVRVQFSFANGAELFYVDGAAVFYAYHVANTTCWSYMLPIAKGSHTMRTSTSSSRIAQVVFYPFKGES